MRTHSKSIIPKLDVLYVDSKLNLQYHVMIPDQAIALDA